MALVVYIYKFKNRERMHLAVELTSIKPGEDKYCNYISYYSYEESQIAEEENGRLAQYPSVKSGCGGNHWKKLLV